MPRIACRVFAKHGPSTLRIVNFPYKGDTPYLNVAVRAGFGYPTKDLDEDLIYGIGGQEPQGYRQNRPSNVRPRSQPRYNVPGRPQIGYPKGLRSGVMPATLKYFFQLAHPVNLEGWFLGNGYVSRVVVERILNVNNNNINKSNWSTLLTYTDS